MQNPALRALMDKINANFESLGHLEMRMTGNISICPHGHSATYGHKFCIHNGQNASPFCP